MASHIHLTHISQVYLKNVIFFFNFDLEIVQMYIILVIMFVIDCLQTFVGSIKSIEGESEPSHLWNFPTPKISENSLKQT